MSSTTGSSTPLIDRLRRERTAPILTLTQDQKQAIREFQQTLGDGLDAMTRNPCLCGAEQDLNVAERDRYGLPLNTALCQRCGLMRSDPYYRPRVIEQFYARFYRRIYSDSLTLSEFFESQQRIGDHLLNWLRKLSIPDPASVLEVGCGAGGILYSFRRRTGARVAGCDLDRDYLDCGIKRGLKLELGAAASLTPHAPADLVILCHVLEHLPDPERELTHIRNLLKENGLLLVEAPGILAVRSAYGDPARFFQNAHVWHFTLATLDSLMSRVGFRRLAGEETLRALYRKALPGPARAGDPQSAEAVVTCLKRADRFRFIPAWKPVKRLMIGKAKALLGNEAFRRVRRALLGSDGNDGR